MNILIAEDDAVSRKILNYVLSRLDNITVYQVSNGQEAVDICAEQDIDLIFMDIGMPVLNGIDATLQIRKFDKDVLIVGVSADGEDTTIHSLLRAGAEDYIVKPINVDILKQRVRNYVKVVENRKLTEHNSKPINTFGVSCSSYFTVFKVIGEHDLAKFWEYMMSTHIGTCAGGPSCRVNVSVNAIFNIGMALAHRERRFLIFIEPGDDKYYISITGISDLNKNLVSEIATKELQKSESGVRFSIKGDMLSIETSLIPQHGCSIIEEKVTPTSKPTEVAPVEPILPAMPSTTPSPMQYTPQTMQVFDFIEADDLIELRDYLVDLESTMSVLQYSALSPEEVAVVSETIYKISGILGGYNETFDISIALKSLSYDIKENADRFIEKSRALSGLFITFSADLKDWKDALFVNGASSADFMDATIIANASTIANLIKPVVVTEDDSNMDDIFGF